MYKDLHLVTCGHQWKQSPEIQTACYSLNQSMCSFWSQNCPTNSLPPHQGYLHMYFLRTENLCAGLLKGTVQRILTGVETRLNRSVLTGYTVAQFSFLILKGNYGRSITKFSASDKAKSISIHRMHCKASEAKKRLRTASCVAGSGTMRIMVWNYVCEVH